MANTPAPQNRSTAERPTYHDVTVRLCTHCLKALQSALAAVEAICPNCKEEVHATELRRCEACSRYICDFCGKSDSEGVVLCPECWDTVFPEPKES